MSLDKVTFNENLNVSLEIDNNMCFLFYGIFTKTCFSHAAIFVMEAIEEQRVCVQFCFKLGKSSNETFELLQQAFRR